MAEILALLGTLGFVGFFGVLTVQVVESTRRMRQNLEAAAERFGARVVANRWLVTPFLQWTIDDVPGKLTYNSAGLRAVVGTRLRFSWTPPGSLRIVSKGIFASMRRLFGARDLLVGDSEFDAAFSVQGAPDAWASEVLSPEACRLVVALGKLRTARGGGGIRIDLGPPGLTIISEVNLTYVRGQLDQFIDHSIALLGMLRGWKGTSMQVLSVAEAVAAGRCAVCANPLEEPVRRCPTCRTPQHQECWDYFGGCAIFACAPRPREALPEAGGKDEGK